MINLTKNFLRGRPWLIMLAALFAWLLPQTALADDDYTTYVDMSYNYGVSLDGSNTVKIHVPVYQQEGADCWIKDGKLKVSIAGASEITLFEWKASENIDGDADKCWTTFSTEAGGYIQVTLGNTSNNVKVTSGGAVGGNVVRNNDDAETYDVTALWYVPYDVLGKKLTFKWDVLRNGNNRKEATLTLPAPEDITMPSAGQTLQPITSDAMLSTKFKGQIEVPWFLASNNITKIRYEYTDANNKVIKVDMPTNENTGVIRLDATVPHNNFRIIASYRQKGEGDSYYDIENVQSAQQNLTMIHAPNGLTATAIAGVKPKVEVKWNVSYLDFEDFALTDFFEIQRSLTGEEKDFKTIGQEVFTQASKKSVYTFVDSTIIESIKNGMLVNGGTLDKLTYRVRRTMSQIWGWDQENNCATSASTVVDNLHLLRIATWNAKWEDERAYTVRVSWDYANEYNGVWDDRAKMILRVISKNRDGKVVEDRKIELNKDERDQRYKVVSFYRPCVHYDVEMYVEKAKSPINFVDDVTDYFFPIRSAQDWKTFSQKVEAAKGEYDVNARLYADITTDWSVGGSESAYYRGIFDGNGHILTFNRTDTELFSAPFRYVGNATIKNLHVAGTISTSGRHAAGLIGDVRPNSKVFIESCRTSTTINSSVNGNAANGGFIAIVNGGASVNFRNCKFDGAFDGKNCSHNGGYVGFSNGTVTIENSLFAAGHITTKTDGCATWARNGSGSLTLINSYAIVEYTSLIVIRNYSDWVTFRDLVQAAAGQYDVDAILEADVNAGSIMVGWEEAYAYRGTFEGNGHTLTFSVGDHSRKFVAPFANVGNATINNLNTAGTITSSQMYPAGLVAQVKNGTATIENCHSSITLKGTMDGEGTLAGIVGRVSNSNVTISNSKFDGRFEGDNCYGNGGFISWVDATSSATINNCLFAPDRINTKTDNNETWARKDASGTVTVTNSHATRGMGAKFIAIRNADDWATFHQMTEVSKGNYWIDAKLEADITTSLGIGVSEDTPWRGTFDGNGHTLNVNINRGDGKPCAVFCYVWQANISNLHVTGKISGGMHSAGLIGCRIGSPTINIDRVWVSTEVTASSTHAAGVIGHVGAADVNMNDVRFDGKITTNNDASSTVGCIIGWGGEGGWNFHRVYNCVPSNPVAKYICFCVDSSSGTGKHWGSNSKSSNTITNTTWGDWGVTAYNKSDQNEVMNLMNGEQAGSWRIVDGKAVPVMTAKDNATIANELLATMGADGWKIVDNKVVPIIKSSNEVTITQEDVEKYLGSGWKKDGTDVNPVTTTMDDPSYAEITKPTLPDFYHTSNGKIEKTLMTETRQSSVVLSWDTDGNPIDYFTVLRREVGQGDDAWQEVATNLDNLSYEDKTVSPVKDYEYKVRATNDCEGLTFSETNVTNGHCKNTGRVAGYVRFSDGTGAAKVKVTVSNPDNGVELATVYTDASGYFVADELPYKEGGVSTTYKVQPIAIKTEQGKDAATVTFDSKINDATLRDFIIIDGKRFSGLVWYEGTSIPVKGARFKVNDMEVYNSAGKPIETDYDGSFSFRVRSGRDTIQVMMDGHDFTNAGYFKGPEGHDFSGDVADIRFYDATKVKLTGRVVGGMNQGNLPLGNNLSTNNLGDSLKMVITLEGDNGSWLVYDVTNKNKKEREEVIEHAGGNGHQTMVKTTRKRMEVTPDPTTGEYVLKLPPVRWKVEQVYCKGYPTLFQEDQVSEVIDLTDCLTPKDTTFVGTFTDVDGNDVTDPKLTYNAIYNRIYRSPIELTYRQQGFDNFSYFGDKTYTATDLAGNRATVPLAYKGADGQAAYTFGYPVFSLERKYYIEVQLAESYRYNNDPTTERLDIVPVTGGYVTVQNGMQTGMNREILPLDEEGLAVFELGVDQTTQLLSGENALKTVTFTAEQDGTVYEAEPLNGFVLNMFPIGAGVDVMTNGQPLLFDILRDPPGSKSSATLSEGSLMNYSYQMDLSTSAGVKYTAAMGEKVNSYLGTVAAPMGAGTASGDIFTAENGDATSSEFVFNLKGEKAYSYTMTTNSDITTSSDPTMVGADADLYIGLVQNIQVMPMSTIRAIPDSMYQHMAGRVGLTTGEGPMGLMGMFSTYGSMLHIAEGYDAQGNKFHLVRDESMAYGPKLQSQFIYSQDYILKTVIPGLAKDILKLMYIGTQEEAQAMANSTKRPVYLSLRDQQDPLFGVANAEYNTTVTVPNDTTNYIIILPKTTDQLFTDEVSEKAALIGGWAQMIAQNEYQKLTADDLVANYDISGADNVSYSESFETNYTNSMMLQFPFADNPVFFSADENKDASEMLGEQIVEAILKALQTVEEEDPGAKMDPEKEKEPTGSEAEIGFGGTKFKWKLTPVLTSECLGTYGSGKQYVRKESFTIAPDPLSHLNVDVYRAALPDLGDDEEEEEEEFELIPDDPSSRINDNSDLATIFLSDKFKKEQKYILKQFEQEVIMLVAGPQGFVFRTRGGATCNPWEDQRTTMIYEPGQVLDQRTLKINNPKIRIDKQSVSGVSVNDAARFTVYLANESEKPEAVYTYDTYRLFADDMSNPNGAKIFVDGQALTANGVSITLIPGMVTEKTIEVRAGKGFDYEGLRVGIESPTDPEHTRELASFDVHFLREAGGVDIAMPGDKWVINTNAQMDGKRGWYIPVVINGFDKHQHNFDHIEFQYKESQRGDDAWTNLCSYYADSLLMANANGVREMIPENGNIVTQFYGESWVIEKPYDLRAVVFCRNGNSFLTTASKIISGVKDTRRPQLFGTSEPKSGLLNNNDDIVFNFSEDIEYNYLRAGTNFEVKGEVNNNELSENVSIQFTGKASVESEAKRNFSGKDVTIDLMVKPAETGREMPLFSHGTNGDKLQLWLTEDFKLKAVINDATFISTEAIKKNFFTQVALVINHEVDSLTFYRDGDKIGKFKMETPYNGTGTLIFGRTNEGDRMDSKYYEGRMMEARLWYRTMDGGLLSTTYGNRRLTGYEQGLVDYYPMNEGSGDYAADHTQGANAKLMGANWAIPRGMSLHLDKADKGLELAQSALSRTAEQDYTLMFWFKTDAEGRGTLLSNGRGLKEDDGAKHQFHIGFEAEKLMYRSNGRAIEVAGNWSDGQWHHYAMTVNRTRNVANIYVDQEVRASFETDSLGGISGGYPLIGASRYVVDKQSYDGATPLKGNIDELAVFAQALPQTLISNFAKKSPNGDEAGLVTYLAFDRQERQSDNTIEMKPYVYSKVIERTVDGGIVYELDPETQKPTTTPARRYEFTADEEVILAHIDATQAAPVLPYEELTNLKYSFIGRGNQVMVELDEPNAKLNHRNIYVTLYDVEDKYGNTLASPQTATFLVTASSLEWLVNRLDVTIKYGSGESCELPFYNNSATNHTYTIENCPQWLTLNKYSDVIAPQALDYVTATVNKDLNIGTYNEILYMTDEEGITEPFYLNLTVEGEQPEWAENISSDLLKNSMNISGQVYLYDELDTDARDIVGVFDSENQCHGFANISHDTQTGETGLYLTVYDSQASGRALNFRLWQYSTGREIVLTPESAITFAKDAMLGSDTPVRFDGGEAFVQNFRLQEGWNWVSFNLKSDQLSDVNTLLGGMKWSDGDILTDLGSNLTLTYEAAQKQWIATGSTDNVTISPKNAYAIKVKKDCTLPVGGTVIKDQDDRTIKVSKGWNAIGYTPMTNLSVETALSDYFDNAEPGDVIKSHTEFAYFTKQGNTGRWRGSLQYMKPGEGYMMLRKAESDASFTYPFYDLNSNFREDWNTGTTRAAAAAKARSTMTVSAVVEGFEVEDGDVLIAYSNGEECGSVIVNSPLGRRTLATKGTQELSIVNYLSIAADKPEKLWFAIERDGEIVASTGEVMTYKANAVIGSPDQPTAINFVKAEYADGQWYSISGMKLQKRPTKSGVYIFNGRKVVVK